MYHSSRVVSACAVVFLAVGCTDAQHTSLQEGSAIEPSDHDKVKIEFLIEAGEDVPCNELAPIARSAAGNHVVLRVEPKAKIHSNSIEIYLTSSHSASMLALVRIIKASFGLGVDHVRVIFKVTELPIACDVFSSCESYSSPFNRRTDHVRIYYADWSVDSVLVEQTVLCDMTFWRLLSRGGMSLVLLDKSRSSFSLVVATEVHDPRTVPTIVVATYRDDTWRAEVFSVNINRDALLDVVDAAGRGHN